MTPAPAAARARRRITGPAVLVAVLLGVLTLSAVLAYEAHDAASSEARFGERALKAEAAFAAWGLAGGAEGALRDSLSAALAGALGHAHALMHAPGGGEGRAALAEFGGAVRQGIGWCDCAAGAHTFFRAVRLEEGGFTLDTAAAHPAAAAALPALLSSPGAARARLRGADLRFDTVSAGGRTVGVAYAALREPGARAPSRLIGFVFEPAALGGPVIGETVRRRSLLPPEMQGVLGNETAFSIVALTPAGDTLYRSRQETGPRARRWQHVNDERVEVAQALAPTPVVSDTMEGALAGVVVRVAVRPEASAVLLSGGRPRSRLPVLAAVFLLTLGLVAVAIAQLRRQHELERLRDDFVSGVSHELRTPLAQIRLFADLLESGRLRSGQQETRSVRIINEEARRLTYLVENVLHFSRAQRHSERVAPAPAELTPLVREIVDSFAPLARARGVETAAEGEEGILVPVDADALRQVLLNLLDNAVKYGPRGQKVRVGVETRGPWAVVRVDDEGPGIPPEERARVWEPYRRLERDVKGAVGGCGIGLAVVRELVELHGGCVSVAGAPGGGARLVVALPGATRLPCERPAASPSFPAVEEPGAEPRAATR